MIFNNSLSKWFSMGRIMLPDLNEFESEIAQVIDEVKYLKEYIQKTSKGWTNIEKKKPQKGLNIDFYFKLTDLGRYIIEQEDPFAPQTFFKKKQKDGIQPLNYEIEHFIVQPNDDIPLIQPMSDLRHPFYDSSARL